jgi:hypothetical protein
MNPKYQNAAVIENSQAIKKNRTWVFETVLTTMFNPRENRNGGYLNPPFFQCLLSQVVSSCQGSCARGFAQGKKITIII